MKYFKPMMNTLVLAGLLLWQGSTIAGEGHAHDQAAHREQGQTASAEKDHDDHQDTHTQGEAGEEAHGDDHDHDHKEGHDEGREEGHGEGGHDDAHAHGHGDEHEEGGVSLRAEQMQAAAIEVESVYSRQLADVVTAPGEVRLNAYRTVSVTPRISAQVVARHARLGDEIEQGAPLVTLSSVEMASAEGDLIVAAREWLRVKKLGRKVVSAQRYTEARVEFEQARARVIAYGMTEEQTEEFIASSDASRANGRFRLLASQGGTVIKDDFIVGELIEPGRELFIISDEHTLWVEARLTPMQAGLVSAGNPVTIRVGEQSYPGRVVQVHHALDENTRTLGVRIEVENPEDRLHPGVFVQAEIRSNSISPGLVVPVDAVLRSPDGDWVVFVEHEPGKFEPQEVELLRTIGEVSVIRGIDEGTRVVTRGAFFVQSELAKSGFEIHNH